MKQSISIVLMATMFSSCGNSSQSKAIEQAKQIQPAIKPGTFATDTDDYTMTAKIDGKDWVASSLMPPDAAGRIVGYYNTEYIGLPYSKTDLVAGKKIIIGEDNAADLLINNGCLWKDIKGEMEITKVDGRWVEGKFFFTTTCTSTNKVVKVTDGFFRIPFAKN
jgi:hypothetical protein